MEGLYNKSRWLWTVRAFFITIFSWRQPVKDFSLNIVSFLRSNWIALLIATVAIYAAIKGWAWANAGASPNDVPSLTKSLDRWEYLAWVATGLVTVGVTGESINAFIPSLKRFKWWADNGNKIASLILIGAVALEFLTGIMTNTLSDRIDATLSKQAADATLAAGKLGVTVNNLQAFVQQKQNDVSDQMAKFRAVANAVNGQMATFKRIAAAQRVRTQAAISSLDADKKNLDTSLAAVKQDQADLTSSLATINQLRQKIHNLTTHRDLTQQQLLAIAIATQPYAPMKFDVSAVHDFDSPDLAFKIAAALKYGGWNWISRPGIDSLTNSLYPNLSIGGAYISGLWLKFCDSDYQAFSSAIDALHGALHLDHMDIKPKVLNTADAKSQHYDCGVLHVVVGSKL